MREATDGRYPTFAIWENVPGAFSSNGGKRVHSEKAGEKIMLENTSTTMIKALLRLYPELPASGFGEQARMALDKSFEETMRMRDGAARAKYITLVYVTGTHTIDGASKEVYVSRSTAIRWSRDFFSVAKRKLWGT